MIKSLEILRAENIHVKYKEKAVLESLSVNIKKGRVVSIIGPNGSGKTTLIRALSRNIKPEKGQVWMNGENIFSLNTKKVAKEMAVLMQVRSCPNDIIVRDLITYGRFAHKEWWQGKEAKDQEIIEWAMKRTGTKVFEDRPIGALSGGEMQRVWIAMALAQKPQILILDEPTTYLDICHQLEILELVKSLNKTEEITVVMVLHDINQASRYSDEILVMKEGKIYIQGTPKDVITKEVIKEVFSVDARMHYCDQTGMPLFYPDKVI